jgi:hypothetical protein
MNVLQAVVAVKEWVETLGSFLASAAQEKASGFFEKHDKH